MLAASAADHGARQGLSLAEGADPARVANEARARGHPITVKSRGDGSRENAAQLG